MSGLQSPKISEAAKSDVEYALPAEHYQSSAHFDIERRSIFWKDWFCVGRADTLERSGDYFEVDLAGERIIVVRARDEKVRAFYNVCRHRGSRLCGVPLTDACADDKIEQPGRFRGAIVCPYHAWTYELDGKLRRAPFFEGHENRDDLALKSVALVNWRGFIWLNLAELSDNQDALEAAFAANLSPGADNIARYPLEDLRRGARLTYHVRANWKILAENYNECYHCGPVHPELCKIVPAFKETGGNDLNWDDGIPHRDGAWTFTSSGDSARAPFPGLSETERTHHKGEILYPNLWLSLAAEHVAAFTLWPIAADQTRVACDFLFHKDELSKPGFDSSDVVEFWDVVNLQDWRICESVQDGMTSTSFTAGIMAPMENASMDIRRYVESRLARGEPGQPD